MDDGLKQRIIGAFVLLAFAVIFIPVIFDRERIAPVDKRTQIPPAPYIESVELTSISEVEVVEPAKSVKEMYIPKEEVKIAVPDNKSVDSSSITSGASGEMTSPSKAAVDPVVVNERRLADDGTPNAWVLQVASFLHEKHAVDFKRELIDKKYIAYYRSVNTEKGRRYRVFVGPKINKAKLKEEMKRFEHEYKTKPIMYKFKP